MEKNEPRKRTQLSDLAKTVGEKVGVEQELAFGLAKAFLEEISGELSRGNRIELRNFAVFEPYITASRVHTPNGKLKKIPPRVGIRFKAGRLMRTYRNFSSEDPRCQP